MTDLSDLIQAKLQEFEELHGRPPDSEEAKAVGFEAFLALSKQNDELGRFFDKEPSWLDA